MSLEFYDTEQVANMLRCEVKTVLRMVSAGELRGAKFGKGYVFSPEAVKAAYEKRVNGQTRDLPDLP